MTNTNLLGGPEALFSVDDAAAVMNAALAGDLEALTRALGEAGVSVERDRLSMLVVALVRLLGGMCELFEGEHENLPTSQAVLDHALRYLRRSYLTGG